MVEIAAHHGGVVGVAVEAPDMGHALFHQERVQAHTDAHQRVPVA